MADHTSDWGDSLNRRRRGGKWNTMVMMFVGGVVLMFEGFFVLFLQYIIYGAGVFVPARLIAKSLLMESSKRGCPESCFLFQS
jgi:hypothetical protein